MGINITSHAVMRYIQRSKPDLLIIDQSWDKWKINNREEVMQAEEELITSLKESKFIVNAGFNKNEKADFFVNPESLFTFVIIGNNLVTCYPVSFNLDFQGNHEMYQVLLRNSERLEKELLGMEEGFNKLVSANQDIRDDLGDELKQLRGRIGVIEQELALLDSKEKLEKTKISGMKSNILSTKEKIVRSKMAI